MPADGQVRRLPHHVWLAVRGKEGWFHAFCMWGRLQGCWCCPSLGAPGSWIVISLLFTCESCRGLDDLVLVLCTMMSTYRLTKSLRY